MNPKFSIIIPVYNVAPYLRECLDSVLAQTFTDWEAICVDDGSTDGSGAILDEYAEKDSRFRIVHQNNAGVSSARNVALDFARGHWIVFCDSDDMLAPNILKTIIGSLDEKTDLLVFKSIIFGERFCPQTVGLNITRHCVEEFVPSFLERVNLWQVAYKRSIVTQTRFVPLSMGEDLVFLIDCFSKAHIITLIDMVGYGYRTRIDSAMHSSLTPRKIQDCLLYNEEMFSLIGKSKKKFGSAFTRSRASFWFVDCLRAIKHLDQNNLCDIDLFLLWIKSISKARKIRPIHGWYRMVSSILHRFPYKSLSIVLCLWPIGIICLYRRYISKVTAAENS